MAVERGESDALDVYADWLEENGDPLARGVRWLVVEGFHPEMCKGCGWTWWCRKKKQCAENIARDRLPLAVFKKLASKRALAPNPVSEEMIDCCDVPAIWRDYDTLAEAIHDAAQAATKAGFDLPGA